MYNLVMARYEWDEVKREANLLKHGLDFADAYLVYEAQDKITLHVERNCESRMVDLALVETFGRTLALIYAQRGEVIRCISFRAARKSERRLYAEIGAEQD
jgi:uncharacterized DUF497 family protein